MFFIFGSPRSGTTLLAQALSKNKDAIVPYETDFIVPSAFVLDRIDNPEVGREMIIAFASSSKGYQSGLGEYLNETAIESIIRNSEYRLADILEGIYGAIAKVAGKRIAGDKSPNDLPDLPTLNKVGTFNEKTKILHIVRDVRDVMVSLNEQGWVSGLDVCFPREWCAYNLQLYYLFKDKPHQYQLIRYEDFTQDPETHLRNACKLLEVEYDDVMLESNKTHPRYQGMECHKLLYEPVTTKRIERYKSVLTQEQIKNYEIQASEALNIFGYTS